mmetsp:Transcript_41504/g.65840  ORF Transcript_41504/g.65840 Transcript_41504/m.65840 type:complete len:501 (-) Transcript_41504:207-1709(-)
MFGNFFDPSARTTVARKDIEAASQNAPADPAEGILATLPAQESSTMHSGTMVSYGDRDPVLAIDGIRRDLGAQRKMLDDFYGKLDPLIQKCVSLSQDMETIKRELSLPELKNMFVSNTRFAEVTSDLKLEMKTTQVAANKTGVNGSSLQAMGQQISHAVNNAFMVGSTQQSNSTMPLIEGMRSNLDSLKQQMEAMRQEFNIRLNDMRVEVYQKAQSPRAISDRSSSTEIQEVRAELKNDIAVLHDLLEHTALKAGHLAIAASECTKEDKAVLFQTLKQKEQQRQMQQYPAMPQTFPYSSPDVFDNLLTRPALPPLSDSGSYGTVEEFTIQLQCAPGDRLGLSLNGQDGRTLLIERINDGLVKRWNSMSSRDQCQVGDRIVAVNGERGDSKTLMTIATESVKAGRDLTLKVASIAFDVRLFCMKDEKLGVSLDCVDQRTLVVTAVNAGLIQDWNTHHPDKAISVGDQIVGANGVKGGPADIIAETQKGGELILSVRRRGRL